MRGDRSHLPSFLRRTAMPVRRLECSLAAHAEPIAYRFRAPIIKTLSNQTNLIVFSELICIDFPNSTLLFIAGRLREQQIQGTEISFLTSICAPAERVADAAERTVVRMIVGTSGGSPSLTDAASIGSGKAFAFHAAEGMQMAGLRSQPVLSTDSYSDRLSRSASRQPAATAHSWGGSC